MKNLLFVGLILLAGVCQVNAEFSTPDHFTVPTLMGWYQYTLFSPAPNYLMLQTEPSNGQNGNIVDMYLYQIQTNTVNGHAQFQSLKGAIPGTFNGQSSKPCGTGFRSTFINGVDYIFSYNFGDNKVIIDACSVKAGDSDNWVGTWAAPKTIDNYWWDDASDNAIFRICGTEDGIYLVRKITENNIPTLDISFIPIEELEGTDQTIQVQHLYSLTNNDPSRPGFSPVPDTEIYDVMVTTHMYPDQPVVIWTYDTMDCVATSFIGPNNYYGEKMLVDQNAWVNTYKGKPRSVVLTEGSYAENPTGVSNINAIVCGDLNLLSPPPLLTYTSDVSTFPNSPWTLCSLNPQDLNLNKAMGSWYMVAAPVSLTLAGSQNIEVAYFFAALYNYPTTTITDGSYKNSNFLITCYDSNQLIRSDSDTTYDTANNFTQDGNLAIPVGFVDGAPPFSYNGYECDGMEVTSEVELSKSSTETTTTSGSESAKATISYENKFMSKRVGLDLALSGTVEKLEDNDVEFSQTTTDTIKHCSMGDNSMGYLLYIAPNLVTHNYTVCDYNGNVPANPEILYLSTMNPTRPTSAHIQGYTINRPPTSGPLAGMMTSPVFDNFTEWNWATWSGGWYDRDWTQSPYLNNYTIDAPFDNIEWSMGGEQSPEYEMKTSSSNTGKVEADADASVRLLGLSTGGTFTFEDEKMITNAITKGISFVWSMKVADDDVCGYDTIRVEPVILTPIQGKTVPWVPATFADYQPWLLTYNLLDAEPSNGCLAGTNAVGMQQKIKANAIPAGTGTITLPPGGIQKHTTGRVQATPASGYRFLHWEAYGIDLDDYSSPSVNATVKTQLSTLRAIFAKNSSSLVNTGIIAIQNSSSGNLVKIQGALPSGFNKNGAMNLKNPVEVRIGGLVFPFGPTVGNRTVVSDHEIAYSTTDSKNGVSTLRIDLSTNKWWFAANQVKNLAEYGITSNVVRVGFGGKNASMSDDILMAGREQISWSGADENISNKVFSLGNATVQGSLRYLNDDQGYCNLVLKDGTLKTIPVNSTTPVKMMINGLELVFSNATSVNGNDLTYRKASADLNTTIIINNQTRTWNATMDGKRLSHKYWGEGVSLGLQVGTAKGMAVIHPTQATYLMTPNLVSSSSDNQLPGMNFGW